MEISVLPTDGIVEIFAFLCLLFAMTNVQLVMSTVTTIVFNKIFRVHENATVPSGNAMENVSKKKLLAMEHALRTFGIVMKVVSKMKSSAMGNVPMDTVSKEEVAKNAATVETRLTKLDVCF